MISVRSRIFKSCYALFIFLVILPHGGQCSSATVNPQTPQDSQAELQRLRLLERKNLVKLEKYKRNYSAQIKIKSNLVIIRLKIRALKEQIDGSSP